MSIYTPRRMIEVIVNHHIQAMNDNKPPLNNPCVCTKIEFRGYEISVSMDSSHGVGDLARADIRVYKMDDAKDGAGNLPDVSHEFLRTDHSMIYGDSEELFRVMQTINHRMGEFGERNPAHLKEALKHWDRSTTFGDVAAIKRYRELTGCGLREAAEMVRGEIRRYKEGKES